MLSVLQYETELGVSLGEFRCTLHLFWLGFYRCLPALKFGGKYHCYQTNPLSELEMCAAYLVKIPELKHQHTGISSQCS